MPIILLFESVGAPTERMASPTIIHLSLVKNRRKLRPSLSTQNSKPLEQQLKRLATVSPFSSPPEFELSTNDLQTAAVVWPFSAWDEYKKELRLLTEREYKVVEDYLSCNYSVLDIMQTSSMLILRCAKFPHWKQAFSSCWTCGCLVGNRFPNAFRPADWRPWNGQQLRNQCRPCG